MRGTLCLAFPDAYAIGMSHHGLQVLYDVMNRRDDWACERAFAPWPDMERLLRDHGLPLYSLETFTPLAQFDVLGFTLQYDLCGTQRPDDARSGRHSASGRRADDRRSAGDRRRSLRGQPRADVAVRRPVRHRRRRGDAAPGVRRLDRGPRRAAIAKQALARLAGTLPHVYVPRFYEPSPEGVPRPRPGHEACRG